MSNIHTCKFCGKKIGIITWGIYRKIVVDAEAVMVVPDEQGEEFVRRRCWRNRHTGRTGGPAGWTHEMHELPPGAEVRGG